MHDTKEVVTAYPTVVYNQQVRYTALPRTLGTMHTDLYLEVLYTTLRQYRQLHVTITSESLNFLKLRDDKTRQDAEPAARHTVTFHTW